MSGSIHTCYDGKPGPCPEYNVAVDIPSSQIMYNTSYAYPMVTAPIDVGMNENS